MEEKTFGYVYHIQNPENPDISDGYVGVVKEAKGIHKRFRLHSNSKSHMRSKIAKFNVKFEDHVKEIFYGPIKECYTLENKLRPAQRMGWNVAVGGGGPYYGLNEKLSEVRSINQSRRMQDSELKLRQSKTFKEKYYSDITSQELRSQRAKEHMANPDKKEICLSGMHKKIKCTFCDYTSNSGNVKQHIKRKHSE